MLKLRKTKRTNPFVEPVYEYPTIREEGRIQGRKEMRDRIRYEFAQFAIGHSDPDIARELWEFLEFIERTDLS